MRTVLIVFFRRPLLRGLAFTLFMAMFCGLDAASTLQAVPDNSDRPASRKFKPGEGPRPGKRHDQPRPFLVAGDPRFERMIELALVPESDLESALAQWPAFAEMDPRAQNGFRRRIETFRQRIHEDALRDAEQMGLVVAPEKQSEFVRMYWSERSRVEREVRQAAEEQLRTRMQEARERIKSSWSSR